MIAPLIFIYLLSIPISYLTFIWACEGDNKGARKPFIKCETIYYKRWFSFIPILNTVIIFVCFMVFIVMLVMPCIDGHEKKEG